MQANVTVTLVLFHPAAFGAGEADAVIAGGLTTVNCTALLVVAATMTDKLPLLARRPAQYRVVRTTLACNLDLS